ncbi:MAG TPA: DUF423 domain-containing protein [Desulfobulbus sp.]|nr:DUF423 domain-containing protein [Desulfobulbus sp.]
MAHFFFGLGSLLAGLAVAAGAYGAHGAETSLGLKQANWITKAARYQMYHGLAMLAIAWACLQWPDQAWFFSCAGFFFLTGTVCFSGSLYLMAFTKIRLGYVTPLGGLAFIIGWLVMAIGAWS